MTSYPRSVVFRVDAEPSIGLGHLARCTTLSAAFSRAGARCTFVTTTPEEVSRRAQGLAVSRIDVAVGSVEDAHETRRAAGDADLVVLDGYRFGSAFAAALDVPSPLWIDDAGFDDARRGHVLNHNIYATAALYPAKQPSDLLLGTSFALLRDEFLEARTGARPSGEIARILITMGGSDIPNVTATMLDAVDIVRASRPLAVRVLVGSLNPHGPMLASRATASELFIDSADVASHMRWANIAISAAGGTAMELACVGVPALVVAIADNQVPVADALSRLGLAGSLGWHADLTPSAVARELQELLDSAPNRESMRARQHEVVDGHGKQRVVDALFGVSA